MDPSKKCPDAQLGTPTLVYIGSSHLCCHGNRPDIGSIPIFASSHCNINVSFMHFIPWDDLLVLLSASFHKSSVITLLLFAVQVLNLMTLILSMNHEIEYERKYNSPLKLYFLWKYIIFRSIYLKVRNCSFLEEGLIVWPSALHRNVWNPAPFKVPTHGEL